MFSKKDSEDLFSRNKLGTFQLLWDNKTEWFEAPNSGSHENSWSGVSKITLEGQDFFIKKQKNYSKRNLIHPFGENLAQKEHKNITIFKRLNIPSLEAVFFNRVKKNGNDYAILITKALSSYTPLNEVETLVNTRALNLAARRTIIFHTAKLIALSHENKVKIQSLYSKHVFVHDSLIQGQACMDNEAPCKFIDLERARLSYFDKSSFLKDVETFSRRTKSWSQSDRLYFLIHYLGEKKVTQQVRDYINKLKSISK
ncbi:lipopolysaccharide kinase InaA family protein [Lentisphaera profundi]|uniref:Lipopolysaccharide kinase InaA family protein n=1 Tax=Lentisphaera profundi TaxID=1658616 RepID=A0ABY7VTU4_9BACT|nr:lipopolysaccharide kinase InaA family protein [Lentisphaera profundi]WDE96734.1 lipopolysaccharide kinase InaA family protein [Lentisphaera profundi]